MLGGELTAHHGYEKGTEPPSGQANRRNGGTTKRVKWLDGEIPLTVPRDRDGSFEPELDKKGQTRIDGIDDKSIGLYAHGLTVRDIQAHLEDLYGLMVSPDLISRVTDTVLGEVREWQTRALETALGRAGLPLVKINPLQARRFAQACGARVKTDPVDAEMPARMAASLQPDLTPAKGFVA